MMDSGRSRRDAILALLNAGDLAAASALLAEVWREEHAPEFRLRLALMGADLSRRAGRILESRTWRADARHALAQVTGPERDELQAEISWSEAVEFIEGGAYGRAERELEAALAPARAASSEQAVRFHRALGAIAARQGRSGVAAAQYRLALDQARDLDAVAQLHSNLALVHLRSGAIGEARRCVNAALAHRGRPGAPPGPHANSLAVRAMIAERCGEDPGWPEVMQCAEASGDVALRAEVALLSADWQRRLGHADAAKALTARVTAIRSEIRQREPILSALLVEAEGLDAWAAEGPARALAPLSEAQEALHALGAPWQALRTELFLAAAEHALGRVETGRARAARVCRRARLLRLDLPPDERWRSLMMDAAVAGQVPCAGQVQAWGWRPPDRRTSGARLDAASGTLILDGERRVLGARSQVFRLLWLLAGAGARGVTIRELERRLWRKQAAQTRLTGRLRVLVARTRALTEPAFLLVLTGTGRYRWNPEVEVVCRETNEGPPLPLAATTTEEE